MDVVGVVVTVVTNQTAMIQSVGDFTFRIKFGPSLQFGLIERLSERLIQKVK